VIVKSSAPALIEDTDYPMFYRLVEREAVSGDSVIH